MPTEEVLAEMRAGDPPVHYLVGTPKGTRPLLAAYDESVAKIGQVRAAQLRYFDPRDRTTTPSIELINPGVGARLSPNSDRAALP